MADGLTNFEIRLLLCSLSGAAAIPLTSRAHPVAACDDANQTEALQNAIHSLVSSVERGAFGDAVSAALVKSMLWQPQNSIWVSARNGACDFYDSVRAHIHSFLDCTHDSNDVLQKHRALLVMVVGVAALLAFWQANVTGPCVSFPPFHSLIIEGSVNDKEWNAWALKQLMVDGCDLVGLCTLPQYLVLAKILLFDVAQTCPSLRTILPVSVSWWARRALLANQLILAERSSSLYTSLTALKPEEFSANWEIDVDCNSKSIFRGATQLEYGFVEYAYGHVDQALGYFEAAREACGLELALTGALGFRTAHQIDPKAQMVLFASTQSDARSELSEVSKEFKPLSTANLSNDNKTGKSIEEDILMLPRLVATDIHAARRQLSSFQQAVVLAQCLYVKKSNPDDELRGWQMAPFIEAVDSQEHPHFLIKSCCQLLRIRWECTRSRTKQRALLMLEQLLEDVRGTASSTVQERMCYAFCLQFPTLSVLRKELAEMMVSCGLVGEALQIFEELELWNSLIDCYCLLGKKAAALDLIKERLKQQPDDPRLWCALGDVTLNEDCYKSAWDVSKHRFGRAQRSLGRSAYNKAEYVRSMQHWEAALALNSLHPDGWFALGSAALKARELDKAVDAFTRAVQLEPENGEAWNNIAAIHMMRKKSKEAFVAFKEAIKFKRSSWQMWENYAQVALEVQNFGQAIEAMNMVLDLSQGKRIMVDCLDKLMKEVEGRYNKEASNSTIGHESRSDDSEKGVKASEEILEQPSSCMSTEAANAIDARVMEREFLTTRVEKLLTRVVQSSPNSATWGLFARWHRVKGDTTMCAEALLKQVRSLQGSDWQHNKVQFEELSLAALQLCDVYMEVALKTGNKKDLYSVQMLLRNLIKQGEVFSDVEVYTTVVAGLADVQQAIQNLT